MNMANINTMISITLSINDLNTPFQRQRLSEQIKKQDPIMCHV